MLQGQIFKHLRESAGKTQSEIAEFLEISNSIVSKWESGDREMSQKYLFPLSEYFGIEVETLKEVLEGRCPLTTVAHYIVDEELSPSKRALMKNILSFRSRVFDSDLQMIDKLILITLPELIDYESGVIVAGPSDFAQFHLPQELVEERWESIIHSEFVELFANSAYKSYAFKLRF